MIENSTTTVVPGDGLVHRSARAVLLLPRLTVGQLPPARALIRACALAAGDSTGRSTVLTVAGILSSGGSHLPAFGLGLDTDQGLVVLLHDEVEAEVQVQADGSAPVRLNGTDSLAWVERRFPLPLSAFRLWIPGSPHQTYPGTGLAAAEGIALDLSRGTLHGSGVVLTHFQQDDVQVTAERAAMVSPTTSHSTLPADRSYGSLLPATPQFGQPQIEPTMPAAAPASQVHLPIQPHLQNRAAPTPNQGWAGHFPLDQCQGGPAPAAPDRSELMHRDPNRPEALTAADSNVPVHPEVLHAQADMTPASANPAQAFPADSAEALAPEPLRTPGGGIAVPRNNVPPIEGVLCARGHFTDPQAAYCAICGISMQQVSRQITRRPRPPLGVLVLDDGTSMTVDGDLIIGRDPTSHPAVIAGDAKPMFLNDEVDGVSRVHARITLVDWTVCLTDENSANGTYLATTPAGTNGQAVRGDVPVELSSGTVIRIGRRTLTFDAYHSAGE